MINRHSSFFSGFFVGALASSATALLFAPKLGGKIDGQARQKTVKPSPKVDRALVRYTEELGTWSGKGAPMSGISAPSLPDAPMGWY